VIHLGYHGTDIAALGGSVCSRGERVSMQKGCMLSFHLLWQRLRDTTWLVPTVLVLGAIALAVLVVWIDRSYVSEAGSQDRWWLYGGDAGGARGLLNTISVSLISVTGVLFSVTIVALQLASSQFTPRILQNFVEDRSTQVVLGAFIGTFAYSVLVQWSIRSSGAAGEAFVPALSLSGAIVLVLGSVCLLIYYIDHLVHFIRASVIIDRIASDARRLARKPFPVGVGRATDEHPAELEGTGDPVRIDAGRAGYLQSVDADRLFGLERTGRLVVKMEQEIGLFILQGERLASVWSEGSKVDREDRERIRRAFVLGKERTPQHDVGWGLTELSDMAVKALSTGLNDPTTAQMCIDRLGETLVVLATTDPPARVRTGKRGGVLLITPGVNFERAVGEAFDGIRRYATVDAAVLAGLLSIMGRVATQVREEHHPPLRKEAVRALRTADEAFERRSDREMMVRAARRTLERLGGIPGRRSEPRGDADAGDELSRLSRRCAAMADDSGDRTNSP
jgi:uncharacterized membrane protein